MQIKLIKKCGWKKVYLNVLDKEYNIIRTIEITIKNNEGILDFNSDKDFFYYLSNEKERPFSTCYDDSAYYDGNSLCIQRWDGCSVLPADDNNRF